MEKEAKEVSISEAAWMAGFVDGEGCLTICKQVRKNRPSPSHRAFVTVTNTNMKSMDIFVENYGGQLRAVRENRKDKMGVNWADAYAWYCPVSSCRKFLTDIIPYLRIKGPQADLLIRFMDTRVFSGRVRRPSGMWGGSGPISEEELEKRDALKRSVQLLNKKGTLSRSETA